MYAWPLRQCSRANCPLGEGCPRAGRPLAGVVTCKQSPYKRGHPRAVAVACEFRLSMGGSPTGVSDTATESTLKIGYGRFNRRQFPKTWAMMV
ncbi:hypothetical protein B296_00007701 [Ensete ventricosum]|uniref:Uncharacterized protein n=1 Tax=Ensete ventricosum TaxID=4639 RepID=A0A426YZ93_ENSVE|nr:hypothetical protein B296_00007701 [Ensete ventricosum]